MAKLPALTLRRVGALNQSCSCGTQQVRHATFLRRPHRPYTFTQLVTLSDGSTYTQRTTSPAPVYKSTRDTRNNPMWQPSKSSLRNVEEDEAGRLRAFREKFGRGWDADTTGAEEGAERAAGQDGGEGAEDSLMDLISGYSSSEDPAMRWEKSTTGTPKPRGGK
jgi:hypothetical protein